MRLWSLHPKYLDARGLVALWRLPVSSGQLAHEWRHLMAKLARRSPALHRRWRATASPQCHPLFRPRPGPVEPWERA